MAGRRTDSEGFASLVARPPVRWNVGPMPKVMVVDDEESLLEAIRYALSREGFDVVTATDGGDAIRFGLGSVWLSNLRAANVWRLDPKRIVATLPE